MAETYEITGQLERMILDASSRPVKVVTVTFTTKPGAIVGTVDVPTEGYGPEAVDAAVRPRAAQLEAVRAL